MVPKESQRSKLAEDCEADPSPFMELSVYGTLQEEDSSQSQGDEFHLSELRAPGPLAKERRGCQASAAESSQSAYTRAAYNFRKGPGTFISCSSLSQALRQEVP